MVVKARVMISCPVDVHMALNNLSVTNWRRFVISDHVYLGIVVVGCDLGKSTTRPWNLGSMSEALRVLHRLLVSTIRPIRAYCVRMSLGHRDATLPFSTRADVIHPQRDSPTPPPPFPLQAR